ncbi:hypothetical protein [Cystobacter ferrugineus]|uniref:Uncharacterized protein n=1 Tax=Cystobacter ferrugineus TaxID=83449 RepID=A0A1L9BJP9_9BACT|nr:hypothetical protein [Cystobacter ferrugineus]OJH42426.1 hypothetical protein BON30_04315 [Cystobacter ferrugineus]
MEGGGRRGILDVAEVFRLAARASTQAELDALEVPFTEAPDAVAYGERLRLLEKAPRVATDLRGLSFRPSFVRDGLVLASQYAPPVRMFVLDVVATGLTEFLDHFAHISRREGTSPPPAELEAARVLQKRYFAYCLAWWTELGMEFDEVFLTMKEDALDLFSAAQVRECLDGGPEAILGSELFTEEERALWKDVFDGAPGAWTRMRRNLVDTYQLPFRALPALAARP